MAIRGAWRWGPHHRMRQLLTVDRWQGLANIAFWVGLYLLVIFQCAIPLVERRDAMIITIVAGAAGYGLLRWGRWRDKQQGFQRARKSYWVVAALPWLALGALMLNAFVDAAPPVERVGTLTYQSNTAAPDPRRGEESGVMTVVMVGWNEDGREKELLWVWIGSSGTKVGDKVTVVERKGILGMGWISGIRS